MTEKRENSSGPGLDFDNLKPREICQELDKFIVGQDKAKRALALALRDRVRRQALPEDMAGEVRPRNIILIGSTGVGKSELARRLARCSGSPFLKIEASKFTEVGYVGRDVDSMIRDLTEIGIEMVREEMALEIEKQAERNAEDRLLALLGGKDSKGRKTKSSGKARPLSRSGRAKLRSELRAGKLDAKVIEIEVQERFYPSNEPAGVELLEEEGEMHLRDLLASVLGSKTYKRKMPVSEAIDYLVAEEEAKLIDMDQVTRSAISRVEQQGIVFVDEMDKIAGRESGHGPEVSREGVQRDLLPIVEGTSVPTRFGMVHTHQILFIAAGAFHVASPSDLIPELQGRFPVRIEMDSLGQKEFEAILLKPKNALVNQYRALLKTEGISLRFTRKAVQEIARIACQLNETSENIGARRLHTVMEALLEEVSFEGPDLSKPQFLVDFDYVRKHFSGTSRDSDLSRHIL